MRLCFLSGAVFTMLLFTGCGWRAGGSGSDAPDTGQAQHVQYADANTALSEGTRFLDDGNLERAIDALNQAVVLNPDLAEAYFKLGIAYRLAEMGDELEGVNPEEGEQISGDSNARKKTNSQIAFEKAVEAYRKIVDANPEDHNARFLLGRALGKLNLDNEAARELRQAAKLNPEDTEYQTELGAMLIRLAKYQEAMGALRKALEVDPSNSQAEELLERAQAGRQRLDYVTIKKEEKADEEEAANDQSDGEPTASDAEPTQPSNSASPKLAAKPTPPAEKTKP